MYKYDCRLNSIMVVCNGNKGSSHVYGFLYDDKINIK